jgi:iron(III) transport system permease protein
MQVGRRALQVGAGLVLGLALVPLVGIGLALVSPPPDPFGGAAPSVANVLAAPNTMALVRNSLVLSTGVAVAALGIGAWLAWAEQRLAYSGRRLLGVLGLLPMAIPSYIVAATAASALGPGGLVGGPLGLPRLTGLPMAALVLTVVTVPYVQLVVGASLARSSAAEEEAARTLGASPWRRFSVAVLPRLRPSLAFSGLITLLYAISDFGAVAVLDVPVLTWRLYEAVRTQSLARAAVYGLLLLLLTLPLFGLSRWLRGRGDARQVANPRPPERRAASAGALALTFGLYALVVGVGVVLPVITMLDWVWDGVQRGLTFASPWGAVADTVLAAGLGALITLSLAVVPAWVVGSKKSRFGALVEQGVMVTSALPGVLLAFGLVLATLAVSRALGGGGLYQAMLGGGVLLGLGYAMRFLAEVFGPVRSAVLGLDPRLWDSSRLLGASRWRFAYRVAAPALAPGLSAGLLIGFIAIMKELPVTLLLGGATGLRTLAFRVWDRYNEALLHDAGLSGLLLIALATVALVGTLRWRRHA